MSKQVSYRDIADTLARIDAEMGAAECHGMCCGVLCANDNFNVSAMTARLVGSSDSDSGDGADQLGELLNATIAQLHSGEYDLRLLLPDDEAPLHERTAALGQWCQGFVMGLSAGGVSEDTDIPKDSRELLLDFTRISYDLHRDQDLNQADGDEQEQAYTEIEEYVRVGVLLIREELQSIQPDGQIH